MATLQTAKPVAPDDELGKALMKVCGRVKQMLVLSILEERIWGGLPVDPAGSSFMTGLEYGLQLWLVDSEAASIIKTWVDEHMGEIGSNEGFMEEIRDLIAKAKLGVG